MRVWIYGTDLEQVEQMKGSALSPHDTVVGVSVRAGDDAAFPQRGLTPALDSAMRAQLDQLIIPDRGLLGDESQQRQMEELFRRYGAAIRSASNCGIRSS